MPINSVWLNYQDKKKHEGATTDLIFWEYSQTQVSQNISLSRGEDWIIDRAVL